jgi:hypothetical protein
LSAGAAAGHCLFALLAALLGGLLAICFFVPSSDPPDRSPPDVRETGQPPRIIRYDVPEPVRLTAERLAVGAL